MYLNFIKVHLILIIKFYLDGGGADAIGVDFSKYIPPSLPLPLMVIIFNSIVFIVAKLKGGLKSLETD